MNIGRTIKFSAVSRTLVDMPSRLSTFDCRRQYSDSSAGMDVASKKLLNEILIPPTLTDCLGC